MVINSCNYSCYIYSVCHKKCTENLAKFKQLEPRQFKVEANSKKRDLGVDHLAFEGGGGWKNWFVQDFSFLAGQWCRQFF